MPLLLALFACRPPAGPVPVDPSARYQAAVADAAVAEASEVAALVRVVPDDPGTTWRDGRVLLVTWTSWTGYAPGPTTLGRETWVTPAPGLQETCRAWNLDGERLDRRLEQRLGLPPSGTKDRFVAIWVDPADVFRPCPSPAIDAPACAPGADPQAPADHTAWMADLEARSYGEGGYPWTRLGYTYDWGGASEVGETELVVRAGAAVVVEAVAPTAEYCR